MRTRRWMVMALAHATLALMLLTPHAVAQERPDRRAPAIERPESVTVAAVDAGGAFVDYLIPAATDAVDGPVAVACTPPPGVLFPLGKTRVVCEASDAAGNTKRVAFTVRVVDQTPPVIAPGAEVVVAATSASGARVDFPLPAAVDNVDGAIAARCDARPGQRFPVGATIVNCGARDAAGNQAAPVAFQVIVQPPPEAAPDGGSDEPTPEPAKIDEPDASAETDESATDDPGVDGGGSSSDDGSDEVGGARAETPAPVARAERAGGKTGRAEREAERKERDAARAGGSGGGASDGERPVRAELELPWPPPDGFVIVTDGGPISGLSAIWRYHDYPLSQEFGHTAFSIRHYRWYWYGRAHGLDGFQHTGLDVAMPAGTWLYSPVNGTVVIAGGVPWFTFYGNGAPGVGELRIETEDGDQVILGHMGKIVVEPGDEVRVGQFVGLSGGENGDHLHLETRELQPGGWHKIVDPRDSFLIDALEEAEKNEGDGS